MTETREVFGVWNLDGAYCAIDESQTYFASEEEAKEEAADRVVEVMDSYAWQYSEAELNAVPMGEDDCIDSLTHDYVAREGNDQTNEQLLEAMARDFVIVDAIDATIEELIDYCDGDEDSALAIWHRAGGEPFTREIEQWPLLRSLSVGRIVRVWHYALNLDHNWIVVADSQGGNKVAYERGYFAARETYNYFAKEAVAEAREASTRKS